MPSPDPAALIEDVRRRIWRDGPLPYEQDVALQLADALEAALADLAAAKEALIVLIGNEDIAYDHPRDIAEARDALARLGGEDGDG